MTPRPMHKIDHPQYHLKEPPASVGGGTGRRMTDEEKAKYVWRNGSRLAKR